MARPFPSRPFVLLDDGRAEGARAARLYSDPTEVIVARRIGDVERALSRMDEVVREGLHLAGVVAYEAGLALEPRLAGRVAARTGAGGPLLWFGAFAGYEEIAPGAVPGWLADRAEGEASLGPLDPTLSIADYLEGYAAVRGKPPLVGPKRSKRFVRLNDP